MATRRIATVLLCSVLLVACGGGGSRTDLPSTDAGGAGGVTVPAATVSSFTPGDQTPTTVTPEAAAAAALTPAQVATVCGRMFGSPAVVARATGLGHLQLPTAGFGECDWRASAGTNDPVDLRVLVGTTATTPHVQTDTAVAADDVAMIIASKVGVYASSPSGAARLTSAATASWLRARAPTVARLGRGDALGADRDGSQSPVSGSPAEVALQLLDIERSVNHLDARQGDTPEAGLVTPAYMTRAYAYLDSHIAANAAALASNKRLREFDQFIPLSAVTTLHGTSAATVLVTGAVVQRNTMVGTTQPRALPPITVQLVRTAGGWSVDRTTPAYYAAR